MTKPIIFYSESLYNYRNFQSNKGEKVETYKSSFTICLTESLRQEFSGCQEILNNIFQLISSRTNHPVNAKIAKIIV